MASRYSGWGVLGPALASTGQTWGRPGRPGRAGLAGVWGLEAAGAAAVEGEVDFDFLEVGELGADFVLLVFVGIDQDEGADFAAGQLGVAAEFVDATDEVAHIVVVEAAGELLFEQLLLLDEAAYFAQVAFQEGVVQVVGALFGVVHGVQGAVFGCFAGPGRVG